MFCTNCGRQLPDTAKFCSECGYSINSSEIQNGQEEKVIKEGLCNRVKSKFFVQNGHGILTNKRFIYSKHSLAKIAGMGVLVNLTKGDQDFDIPIADIAELKEGKQGISKTIIIVTKTGEEYNFYFTDRQIWLIEFQNLISK